MAIYIALVTTVGMLLAFRFQVLVVIPAQMLIVVSVATLGVANGEPLRMIILMVIGAVASLQIGYLFGCALQIALQASPPQQPLRSKLIRQ